MKRDPQYYCPGLQEGGAGLSSVDLLVDLFARRRADVPQISPKQRMFMLFNPLIGLKESKVA
jgi:hypothetical protein